MKKLLYAFLGGLLVMNWNVQADDNPYIDGQDLSREKIQAEDENAIFYFSLKGDWIQQAKIDKRSFRGNHVKFWDASAVASAIVYYDKGCEEGLLAGIGYNHTRFDWNKNPYFHRKNFDEAQVSLTGFSKRLCDWLWQAQVTMNWDTRYNNFSEYTNYDIFLWGRYQYSCNVNIHAGFYAQTGMKIDHIWPVLGFDWTINDTWKLNLVFPFNMSLVYTYSKNWSVALAGRLFNYRYRVGKHEPLPQALLEYYNKGIEFVINYDGGKYSANIHAGSTLSGRFTISDKNHKHKHHYNFNASAYAGGELSLKF